MDGFPQRLSRHCDGFNGSFDYPLSQSLWINFLASSRRRVGEMNRRSASAARMAGSRSEASRALTKVVYEEIKKGASFQ